MEEPWQEKIRERVKRLGFDSVETFFASRPGLSTRQLADELGADIIPAFVTELRVLDAVKAGRRQLRRVAMDLLVRAIREQLPDGWSQTQSRDETVSPEFMNVTAMTLWGTEMHSAGISEEVSDRVWDALCRRAQPGWIPASTDDETIQAAFAEAWPLDKQ
jgi:hypothetical protein